MPVHIGSFRKSIGGLTVAIWFVLQVVGSVFLLLCGTFALAQQTIATNTNAAVPPLVNFSGTLTESNGKPLTGTVAVTFSLYSEPSGGAAQKQVAEAVPGFKSQAARTR